MAESNLRLNKPISDETMYAAGMPRDIPEKEPVPAPPLIMPPDMDSTQPGIEYRAMSNVPLTPRDGEGAGAVEEPSPFAWLARRRARGS